jgi:hypothetical protein
MYLFLSITVQMSHDQRDRLKVYWSTPKPFFMAHQGNTMKQGRFFHILRFLDFCDNRNDPDKTHKNYDRSWKTRNISDNLTDVYAKYYSPTEHGTKIYKL